MVCHPWGIPWHHVGSFVKSLSPLHFLCTKCLQPLQKMLLLPTPVRQRAHGNSPELCRKPRPVPQIMIIVFPAFTLSPFSSIASLQIKSLLTHSSSHSVMITSSVHLFDEICKNNIACKSQIRHLNLLGVNKNSSNLAVLSETARYPMSFSVIISVVQILV